MLLMLRQAAAWMAPWFPSHRRIRLRPGKNDADFASAPCVIPEGYTWTIAPDENVLNAHVGIDWEDTNTVNETGKHAGRYLSRTHAMRGDAIGNDGNSARNQRRQRRCNVRGRPENRRV